VLQVLRAFVDLHASPQGTLPMGTSTFDLTVGHIQGAVNTPITGVTVAVQSDGATTWTTLPVTKVAAGRYRASFAARPFMNGLAMNIRVTATDADGGILRQVTTRSFVVGS
jgi:hypothetical protein